MHLLSSFLLATAAISSSFAAPLGSQQDDGVHGFDSSVSSPATRDVASLEPRVMKRIEIGGYEIYPQEELGRGVFGDVYAADIKPGNGRQVAVKIVPDEQGSLYGVATVHRTITDWTNIIKIITYGVAGTTGVSVMEKADELNLEGRIRTGYFSRHETTLKTDIMGVVRGLAVMHSGNLAHSDVHSGNIVFVDGVAKLIDFDGVEKGQYHGRICGRRDILSPEALDQSAPIDAFENDVWGAGVTLFRMITGHNPWEDASDELSKSILAAPWSDRAIMLKKRFPEVPFKVCKILANVFAPQAERYSANDLYRALNNVDRFYNSRSRRMAIRADPNDEGNLDTLANYICPFNPGPSNRTAPTTSSGRVNTRASLF